MLIINVDRRS